MITLLTYPAAFGLFSSSPFCVKAAWLLNMAGVPWEREDMIDPRKMPHGKLPAIRDAGRLIADSDRIRAHLEAGGHDFDAGLSEIDCATARAFIRMTEEHLYFHLVLDRWGDDRIWPKVRDTYFGTIPAGLRHFLAASVRRQVLKGLHQQGLGRLNTRERLERIKPDLDAITARLRNGRFLMGDTPTAADASVAPMLAAAIVTPGDTALRSLIMEDDVLTGYVERAQNACG